MKTFCYSALLLASTVLRSSAQTVSCTIKNGRNFDGHLNVTEGNLNDVILITADNNAGAADCDFSSSDTGTFGGWSITTGSNANPQLMWSCTSSTCRIGRRPPINWKLKCATGSNQLKFMVRASNSSAVNKLSVIDVDNKDNSAKGGGDKDRKAIVSKFAPTPDSSYIVENGERNGDGYDVKIYHPTGVTTSPNGNGFDLYLKVTNKNCEFLDWA